MIIIDKEHANSILRYTISVLKGKEFTATYKTKLEFALYNKESLLKAGFWWQAKNLDYWIHRYQRGDFTASAEADRHRSGGEDSP
ncbi:hypothetical protein JW865_06685 [Candidatus Bathyarchaeota archaeon]|nr:hypothetical protein [Candidatus Bathyarchaeota archaeon]